jgi:hypothetical protein
MALYALFAAVIGLPMVTNFYRLSSSVSFGTALAALAIVALQSAHGARARFTKHVPLLALVVTLGVALHLGLAAMLGNVDLVRGLGTVPLLAICIVGAAAAADLLSRARQAQLRHVVHRCTQVLLVLGFWGGLGLPEPSFGDWSKPIFPFTEPSHFAVTIGPYLIFTCITSRTSARLAYVGAALLATVLLQSTTLAAIVFLTLLLCLRLRHVLIVCALIAPLLASLDLTYYLSRLDFSGEADNLTTLVYLQGWQLIGESWDASHWLGIGFQQLGVFGSDVSAAQLIAAILHDADASLNLFDGGFTLAKILSEFGIFGAALLLAFASILLRAAARLHRHVTRLRHHAPGSQAGEIGMLLACAFIVGSLFELFLRGIGYFTPTSLMVLASLWMWWKQPTQEASA